MEACDERHGTWVKVMWNIFQGQSEPKRVHSRVQLPQHAFLGYKRLRIVENGWKYIKSSTPLTNDYVWVITTTFSCSFLWLGSQPSRIPGRGSLKVGCVLCITYKYKLLRTCCLRSGGLLKTREGRPLMPSLASRRPWPLSAANVLSIFLNTPFHPKNIFCVFLCLIMETFHRSEKCLLKPKTLEMFGTHSTMAC